MLGPGVGSATRIDFLTCMTTAVESKYAVAPATGCIGISTYVVELVDHNLRNLIRCPLSLGIFAEFFNTH